MDTREMIVAIVAILAGTAVLLSPAACTINRHILVAEAIKAGGDPQAVRCAIEAEAGISVDCILIANKQGDKR